MKLLKYFALEKVDETTHTVYGRVTAEVPDKDGEICDYDSAKKAYKTWSDEAYTSTSSAGQEPSYGNIRVMHRVEEGGKAVAPPEFRDDEREVWLATQPIDDKIWTRIQKGIYRGFSQGGDYAWRKCKECGTDVPEGNGCSKCKRDVLIRYGPVITEVSYVDNPCVGKATFTFVKADGSSEMRKFADNSSVEESAERRPTMEKVDAVETATAPSAPAADEPLAKTGPPGMTEKLNIGGTVLHVEDGKIVKVSKGIKYLVTENDGTQHLPYTNEEGTPDHRLMGGAWAALHGGYRGNKYEGPNKEKAIERLKGIYNSEGMETPSEKVTKLLEAKGLNKSLGSIGSLASVLQQLYWIKMDAEFEAQHEGGTGDPRDAKIAEDLDASIGDLVDVLKEAVVDETSELMNKTESAAAEGVNKMAETNALNKAKSAAGHIAAIKAQVSDHCAKMCAGHEAHKKSVHDLLGKIAKVVGVEEMESGTGEVESMNPAAEGTKNEFDKAAAPVATPEPVAKTAGTTYTEADFEAAVEKGVQSVLGQLLAKREEECPECEGTGETADGEECPECEGEGYIDKAKKAKKASEAEKEEEAKAKKVKKGVGVGDRNSLLATGPYVRVMPVTKAQDSNNDGMAKAAPAVEEGPSRADVMAAMSGNPEAVRKLMKGVKVTSAIPTHVAASLPTL